MTSLHTRFNFCHLVSLARNASRAMLCFSAKASTSWSEIHPRASIGGTPLSVRHLYSWVSATADVGGGSYTLVSVKRCIPRCFLKPPPCLLLKYQSSRGIRSHTVES